MVCITIITIIPTCIATLYGSHNQYVNKSATNQRVFIIFVSKVSFSVIPSPLVG